MLSGQDTLRQMDASLKSARRELARLDQDLQVTSRAISDNKLQQARAIERLAAMRLDAARRGEVSAHLETATREAMAILETRQSEMDAAGERVRASAEAVETLERRREALHADVDAAAKALAEREAAVQQGLERNSEFQAQLERTRAADAVAVSALEKAELAAADRREKGGPYERDELFMYLWRRGYGTSGYRANPLARLLDGWVARLCRYQDARPNYWMLLEIPRRLAEHAAQSRERAEAELDGLQDIEEAAAAEGGVPAARAELEALEDHQDQLDAEIAAAEESHRSLLAEQNRYTAGTDDHLQRALRTIAQALESQDIDELGRLALATMTVEDDAIVDDLNHLRQHYFELEDELQQNRSLQQERLSRIRELEEVRREFKLSRYDDLHSSFDKSEMIERMIGEVIAGVIQGSALWNTLRRYQRYIDAAGEWPDFGSGGILRPDRRQKRGRRERPPTWHWPGPKSRGGGFRVPKPRGGGGSRGGFRTGGRF